MFVLFECIRIVTMIGCDNYSTKFNELSSRYCDYNNFICTFTFNNNDGIIEVFSIANNGYVYYNVSNGTSDFITPVMLIQKDYIRWIEIMQTNPSFYRGTYKKPRYKIDMLLYSYIELWYSMLRKSKEWTPTNIKRCTIASIELAEVKKFLGIIPTNERV